MAEYKIRELCGDWALDIPMGNNIAVLYFNSRANAELVKNVLDWEDAHPNEAVPYNAPTIDPESLRPRGHWESPSELLAIVNCPNCKTAFPAGFQEFRYCPKCGAKMEDEQP